MYKVDRQALVNNGMLTQHFWRTLLAPNFALMVNYMGTSSLGVFNRVLVLCFKA